MKKPPSAAELARQLSTFQLGRFVEHAAIGHVPVAAAACSELSPYLRPYDLRRLCLDIKYLDGKILTMESAATGKRAADVSGTHLWLVMMKAHRSLQRLATRSIESSDVGLSDFAVMEMLLHKGPQPVNEIGRRIGLTSGAITTAVDRLESRGLVTREADENDRRARIVRLTAQGKEQAAKVFAAHKAAMDAAASGLSKAERATLIHLLKKLGTSAGIQHTESTRK